MSHSRSLLLTSLALALSPMLAGCPGDDCGPSGAPMTGLVATGTMVTLDYGNLTSLIGNDCPDPAAPTGVISLSIEGSQVGGPGFITFCIPRPDLLMEGDRTLGTFGSTADVRIIDLNGDFQNCQHTIDATMEPTGSATATGVCENGNSAKGFALTLDGALSMRRTCGAAMDSVAVTLRGRVEISKRPE